MAATVQHAEQISGTLQNLFQSPEIKKMFGSDYVKNYWTYRAIGNCALTFMIATKCYGKEAEEDLKKFFTENSRLPYLSGGLPSETKTKKTMAAALLEKNGQPDVANFVLDILEGDGNINISGISKACNAIEKISENCTVHGFFTHSYGNAFQESIEKNGLDISLNNEQYRKAFSILEKYFASGHPVGNLYITTPSGLSFEYATESPDRFFYAFRADYRRKKGETIQEWAEKQLNNSDFIMHLQKYEGLESTKAVENLIHQFLDPMHMQKCHIALIPRSSIGADEISTVEGGHFLFETFSKEKFYFKLFQKLAERSHDLKLDAQQKQKLAGIKRFDDFEAMFKERIPFSERTFAPESMGALFTPELLKKFGLGDSKSDVWAYEQFYQSLIPNNYRVISPVLKELIVSETLEHTNFNNSMKQVGLKIKGGKISRNKFAVVTIPTVEKFTRDTDTIK